MLAEVPCSNRVGMHHASILRKRGLVNVTAALHEPLKPTTYPHPLELLKIYHANMLGVDFHLYFVLEVLPSHPTITVIR
jgi:hypothetical protein